MIGQRINGGITDPVLIREFLENLEWGTNRGWEGMGGGGGTTEREEDKDSGENVVYLLVLKLFRIIQGNEVHKSYTLFVRIHAVFKLYYR